jgi:hypothetical protein
VISGTPIAGAGGIYHFTITASNNAASKVSHVYTLIVVQAPKIISAASATFTVGQFGSFLIKSTGYDNGAPNLHTMLPDLTATGLTYHDNGDGTATLSGTPLAGSGGKYTFPVQASNSAGIATQSFALLVNQPPLIINALPTAAGTNFTFAHGTLHQFVVSTLSSGFPVAVLSAASPLPAGFTFKNNGNGTGTITVAATVKANTYTVAIAAGSGTQKKSYQTFSFIVT